MTLRARLTALYGSLFLLCGTALLALTYVLVRHQYTGSFFVTSGKAGIVAIARGSQRVTVPAVPFGIGPDPATIAAAARAQSAAALHQLLMDCAIALGVMAVLSIWLGWVIAGRTLRPLRTITNAARDVSASSLHRRLALDGPDDELKQLGDTFDGLLARLEASFEAQRQFVANASHELRTPLTYERTLIEVALADPDATVHSLRRACERVLAAGEQQERLIEALLTLSRSQRGLDDREPVDLAAVTSAACAAADHDGLAFNTTLAPARIAGDPRLVERLVANLVSNAVRHNVPEGSVDVRTESSDGRATVAIANTGPHVDPADVPRLFRPFQRAGEAPGLGLGLSIVDAIARAHDATVTSRAKPGGGLDVEVAFPAAL